MTDYRALIAPYLESIRQGRATKDTIRAYTNMLQEFIDFFEQGSFETPAEDFFTALEAKLSLNLAGSTVEKRVRLARRFFEWTQKGQIHMQIEDTFTTESNEKAPPLILDGGQDETLQAGVENPPVIPRPIEHDVEQVDAPTPVTAPLSSPVEEQEQPPIGKNEEPPHEEEQEQSQSTGHAKPQKITIYPGELEEDIKDLARLAALPVSKFILNLIRREVENSKDDLELLRRLRAKRA